MPVKIALPTSLLAASVLAISAFAADQPPAARPAARPAPGPVADAMQSALRELQLAQEPRLPLPVQLDRMAAMRYTPETAAKLRTVFGNEQPFTVDRQPAKTGRLLYRMRLQPLHHADDDGSRVDWDEALLDFDMDKAGKTVDLNGHWNTLAAEEAGMRLSAEDMTLTGRQSRSRDHLWFGNAAVRVARVRAEGKAGDTMLAMDDLRMSWRSADRPKTIDMQFQSRIGAIAVAGEKVEDVRFDMRFVNIDRASMAALQAAGERRRKELAAMTPEQTLAVVKPLLLGFGKASIARGSAIEIDEISARFHGIKASIRGRVGLAGAVESDLHDFTAFAKKIAARFEIRVPVAMVREIGGVVAARQAQQQGTTPDAASTAQMGQTIADVMVGKLVGGGFARIENDVLVSNLEFRDGKLTANGKEVALPTPAPGGQQPATTQRSNLPPGALQARRIEDSCRLPDFPDEVIGQDKPLRAGFAWLVDDQGKVGNVRVTAPSGYPGWDQAMTEVLGQCRYIPALQDGKPIGLQIDWDVARSAGGPRSPGPGS
jgi:uncharacterized protein YdgA (DUF945 family)